jgi:hypothetical protein
VDDEPVCLLVGLWTTSKQGAYKQEPSPTTSTENADDDFENTDRQPHTFAPISVSTYETYCCHIGF